MKATEYAQALYLATQGKSDEEVESILQNAFRILEQKGHIKLLPSIQREIEKILKQTDGHHELLVRVAKEEDVEAFRSQIEDDVKSIQAETLPRRVLIDETLVGGYELRAQGTRVDRTYKRSLLTLYNNLITN